MGLPTEAPYLRPTRNHPFPRRPHVPAAPCICTGSTEPIEEAKVASDEELSVGRPPAHAEDPQMATATHGSLTCNNWPWSPGSFP